MSILKHQLTDF